MTIIQDLNKFPQLLDISDASVSQLEKSAKTMFFEEKKQLINRGDEVSGAYLVVSGSLRVYSIDQNGKEKTLYEVLPGESCLLAMNSLFSGLSYPAWVSCSSPLTKAVFIPAAAYKALFTTEQSVQHFTFNVLSQRIFNIMTVLEEALSFSIEQRLASYLCRKSTAEKILRISHQDIASELGTAREVISRTLKNMEKKECIELSRGLITILSTEKLNAFVLKE